MGIQESTGWRTRFRGYLWHIKKNGSDQQLYTDPISGKGKLYSFDIKKYRPEADSNIIASKYLKKKNFSDKPIIIETEKVITQVYSQPNVGWIPFIKDSKKGDVPKPAMKDNTTIGAMVNFEIPGVFVQEVKQEGLSYYRFALPGQASLTEVGKPESRLSGRP